MIHGRRDQPARRQPAAGQGFVAGAEQRHGIAAAGNGDDQGPGAVQRGEECAGGLDGVARVGRGGHQHPVRFSSLATFWRTDGEARG